MISNYPKIIVAMLFALMLVNIAVAQNPNDNFRKAFGAVCNVAKGLLAMAALVLIVLAAVVYGIGQVLGAETRARATVWATAMLTGAIIGGIIFLILPWIISILMTGQANTGWVDRCCIENPPVECSGFIAGDEEVNNFN